MTTPRFLMNIYELAARLGVPVGVGWELIERDVIRPKGRVYDSAIPIFDENDLDDARAWLDKYRDRLIAPDLTEREKDR